MASEQAPGKGASARFFKEKRLEADTNTSLPGGLERGARKKSYLIFHMSIRYVSREGAGEGKSTCKGTSHAQRNA